MAALRAFTAYADRGDVQSAGDALNVSHAAISQQLRALEDHLGVSLLDRSGRALSLTLEGRALAEISLQGFEAIAQIVGEITGAEAERPVHISTTNSFAANWLMPRLARFRAAHPKIDLVIAPHPERMDPKPGGVDLAIRYGNGPWPGLESELLLDAPVVGVASPDLVGPKPCKTAQDLAKYTWFEELGTHEATGWLRDHGVKPEGGTVTVPGNLAVDAARAGEGVTITTSTAVETDLASGALICLFEGRKTSGYHLIVRPGVHRPALRKLIAWLRIEAKSESA